MSTPEHLKAHQFPKGKSGNPGGRAKGLERTAREAMALRTYTGSDGKTYTGNEAALQCLIDMFFDDKTPTRERVAAFREWADRGYGKAKQSVKIEDERAAAAGDFDPKKLADDDLREALGAIGTLKRLAGMEPADDGSTEH